MQISVKSSAAFDFRGGLGGVLAELETAASEIDRQLQAAPAWCAPHLHRMRLGLRLQQHQLIDQAMATHKQRSTG